VNTTASRALERDIISINISFSYNGYMTDMQLVIEFESFR